MSRLHSILTRLWLPVLLAGTLSGCQASGLERWLPKGPVAAEQWQLMQTTIGWMLVVLIPVFVLVMWIPWHFRAGNRRARYDPDWSQSTVLDLIVWLVPAAIVVVLGSLAWTGTHRLDPYKPLAPSEPPLRVQVVALNWKWLFIYPDQHVASVDKLVIPAGRQVSFELTSATVMNSFFIPRLGSQIYAMAGMTTRLHLQADHPGRYVGRNSQYSGRGFSDQQFSVIAEPEAGFAHWAARLNTTAPPLDETALAKLLEPSTDHPVLTFGRIPDDLFARLLHRFSAHTHVQR